MLYTIHQLKFLAETVVSLLTGLEASEFYTGKLGTELFDTLQHYIAQHC